MFRFKQFTIQQQHAAMKVGTDGVLLGAYAMVQNAQNILDIGTGTGLIALMMAQRNSLATIDAVEIDKMAVLDATLNIKESKWSSRIQLHQSPIQNYNSSYLYDCIVSNPPFYEDTFFAEDVQRNVARHTISLTFDDLFKSVVRLLKKEGVFQCIIPYKYLNKINSIATQNNLAIIKLLYIRGNVNADIKRVIVTCAFQADMLIEETIIIEHLRHQYTLDYINLTKEFYLKM